MRSPRRLPRAITFACVAVLASLAPAAAMAPYAPRASFSMGLGLSVEAPAPGYGVAASALMADGGHLDLVLETGADGVTRMMTGRATEETAAAQVERRDTSARITGGGDACSDSKYNLTPYKWTTTWRWWFQARSTPGGMDKARAENHLRSAVQSITRSRNDCGLADTVSARASYQGRTTIRPGVNNGGCDGTDGRNVVGFGNLPPGVLGLTCTTYLQLQGVDRAIESDVLLNKDDFGWTTSVSGCVNRAIVRSVATHEFGHVFGLAHVGERNHGRLTMSTSIGACDDSGFTLGRGDVLGLRQRY